ncbi:hypothetical protein LAUMK13_02117 [Mycobacterium innocens]|uniref:Uncharacterized protein n=1 Tax=Mycobacterium innocens TaxID=2341083 RepID=A0A498PXK1_9MYCO|nr:hypothetical protein LAUMK13_02117 [Mycobacterium innocens]
MPTGRRSRQANAVVSDRVTAVTNDSFDNLYAATVLEPALSRRAKPTSASLLFRERAATSPDALHHAASHASSATAPTTPSPFKADASGGTSNDGSAAPAEAIAMRAASIRFSAASVNTDNPSSWL